MSIEEVSLPGPWTWWVAACRQIATCTARHHGQTIKLYVASVKDSLPD